MTCRLLLHTTNGFTLQKRCETVSEAYAYVNSHVTFRAFRRIDLETEPGSVRALWDASWDPLSQAAGLTCPK